jgi:hypothetical protein
MCTHSKVQQHYLKRHPISLNTDLVNDEKIRSVIHLDLYLSLNIIRVIKVRKKRMSGNIAGRFVAEAT